MKVPHTSRRRRLLLALGLAAAAALTLTLVASANVAVTIIMTDPFTNSTSQHATKVEPDTYSFGSTIVATAQEGRFTDGGSSDIGVAVSSNNGSTWTQHELPGTTVYSTPAGPYARISDPSVAYDAKHNVWMVSGLALSASLNGAAVTLNRSLDGGATWQNATNIAVAASGQNFDKNWTACDNTTTSPFYGSCYTEWDDNGHGNLLKIAYSRDGGVSWTLSNTPRAGVIGGQPLTLPNGTVVVPLDSANEAQLGYTLSTNGGVKFGQALVITNITAAADPGNIRSGPLPSAEISGDGKIFVVWEDCRFRTNCARNDLVYTTSTNGSTWTAVQRIPADPGGVAGTQDTFIPGVAVDRTTSGSSIKVGVGYYYYPNSNCTEATCQLDVGYISSSNGGSTWTAQTQLRGPMSIDWLPNTTQGRMVGDYMSSSFDANHLAHPVFAEAYAPPTGDCVTSTPSCNEPIETPTTGLTAAAGANVANDPVLFTAKTNRGAAAFHTSR
jgi:sucrose-6-phosphate hydrolase SacC (GH32 family)